MVPLQLLVAFLIGWFQRGQSEVIEYLREENRVLKAQLASGQPTNVHVHADGTTHAAH